MRPPVEPAPEERTLLTRKDGDLSSRIERGDPQPPRAICWDYCLVAVVRDPKLAGLALM